MGGALVLLAVNIAVGSLFAAAYAIIAFSNTSQRRALWFSFGYLLGMVSPACDFLTPLVGAPDVLEAVGYVSFLLASLSISATLSVFYRTRPPWRLLFLTAAFGICLRAWIWSGPRDTLAYSLAYQLPFTLAAILATRSVLTVRPLRALHLGLAGVFAVIAAHFIVKAFVATAIGSGASFSDYTKTAYALFSQASSGVLLLTAGIVLLLLVAQDAIGQSQLASEVDPLSGLANRRGFDRLAQEAMARAQQFGLPVAAAVFDLDHFKRVNDTFGHDTGDAVIARFARRLRAAAPAGGVIGRQGGEEFVLLIAGATLQTGWLAAEAVRAAAALPQDALPEEGDLPDVTVSGGVAELRPGETLSDLLRRADQAAYQAKNSGRNRVCSAAPAQAEDAAPGELSAMASAG